MTLERTDRAALATLLRRSGSGDEAAFAEVYDRTSGEVYALALSMLRDPIEAEGAARRAFVEIWSRAPGFATGGLSAAGWIMATVHALLVDMLRVDRTSEEGDWRDGPGLPTVPAARASRALCALPAPQRDALMLAYIDGRTHTEVAALTGVPVEVAASRIRAGLVGLYELA